MLNQVVSKSLTRPAPGFFRHLVWSLRNGVVAITRDGRIAVMNGVAYRILNLSPRPSDVGQSCHLVLREAPDVMRILAGAFTAEVLPSRAEMRLKPSAKVIGYTVSLIRDEQGEAIGAMMSFKDLTRVEQLEERERLRDRLATLGEMAAAIAHEVKNPLAGIEVMAGILKRQLLDVPDAQTILNDIIGEAKVANSIVLEVLEFVRPVRLEMDPVNLRRVVEDAVTNARRLSGREDLTLRVALPQTLASPHGDHHQLRQVLTNLLVNAFEAVAPGGAVEVAGWDVAAEDDPAVPGEIPGAGQMVVLEVSDDGPGVPPDAMDRIFRPFFTSKPRGSGLGLPIVRKIIDAHDGRIEVGDGARGGARFRITLPVSNGTGPANVLVE